MFVVSPQYEPLSTSVMRFRHLWIFDLNAYHSFWKGSVQKNYPHLAQDPLVWRALLKAYKLHLFSQTDELIPFAQDFHSHRRHPVSSKNIRDIFAHFRRLGLQKVGHLHRLPLPDFQKRFGKAWTDFLKGVVQPDRADWIWEPHRPEDPLIWTNDFDEASVDALRILEAIGEGLRLLSTKSGQKQLQKVSLQLQLSDPEIIDLEFPHPISLEKDLPWIKHLFEERLTRLCLDAAVWRISLTLFPAERSSTVQMSLFETTSDASTSSDLAYKNICERLENQGFPVFKPIEQPSYVPELSWTRRSPLAKKENLAAPAERGIFRPLIHLPPKEIPKPLGRLQFTERITWFDESGTQRQRDYYLARFPRQWAWVFQNESQQWFQQGIVE